jgi:hypothetical protein
MVDLVPIFEELAKGLGLSEYDILIVGDGSGTVADKSCGWYCLSYNKSARQVIPYFGGVSGGTNNLAELEPGIFGLWSYRQVLWSLYVRSGGNKGDFKPLRMVIVSDSEVTVRCGNKQYSRNANAPLWASIDWFERKGYTLTWFHVPRNSNPLNELCDARAGKVRLTFQGMRFTDEQAK